ncbi:hypothetical protein HZC09_07020, partial [Candidatus Micrarchaeota archaeon]|nr:hypothetical protein [Candidatus Micrarchaeota archaeon]
MGFKDVEKKLSLVEKRFERDLARQEALVNEVRSVSYLLLLISAALLALLLGMVLNPNSATYAIG